ncbi:O-antigen ligase family protein [Parabacteroides sp. Marseille-P3160]|uniref:O-antigen ligase family protein n=1 Tax=Parabacteroides sp. Marseille-P3160 TaxID=1917887 RepID=UPI0009B9C4A9|nr:O-antigen ligase family protein [Parabacteroides sp. Marseille-P3160]
MKKLLLTLNILCLVPFIMVLSTVLVIAPDLPNGVVSGKYFWFYLSMGLSLVAMVVSYAINHKKVRFSPVDFLLTLFYLFSMANNYFLWRTYPFNFSTRMILFSLLFVLYFLFRLFLSQSKRNAYVLTLCFLATGLIEIVWGLGQLYGFSHSQHNLFKTTGSLFNPGPYAGYLAVVAPVALFYILREWHLFKGKFNRHYLPFYIRTSIASAVLLGTFLILPATQSRAAWIAAFVGCLAALLLYYIQIKYTPESAWAFIQRHKLKILGITTVLLLAGAAGLSGIYHLKEDSADGRALIWKISMKVTDKYSFGCGIGRFAGTYGEEQIRYFQSGQASEREKQLAGNPEYAFNEYLHIYIEHGLFPSIAFFIMIIWAVCAGIKRRRGAAVGGLLALLVFAFFSYPFNLLPFVIAFVFLMALGISQEHDITYFQDLERFYLHPFQTRRRLNTAGVLFLLILFTGMTAFCLYNRYPTYRAYKEWNQARALYHAHAFKKSFKIYERLHPYLQDQVDFLFEEGQSLSKTGRYEGSNRIFIECTRISCDPMIYNMIGKNYQAMGKYREAEASYYNAMNLVPHRLYPYYLLAKMYMQTENREKAQQMAAEVLGKEVKVDSPAVKEMKDEMRKYLEETRNTILF